MTFSAEHTAIEQRFETQWGTRTPIQYPGTVYSPRTGVHYVQLNIEGGPANQITIGGSSNSHRHIGYINVTAYGPSGIGLGTVKGHADYAAGIFRGQSFSGVNCHSARFYDLGEQDGWTRIMVEIPFYRDELF